ncbi:MAG: RNA 3'-terminal phosphate cyclase [Thermoplasmatota archaeon]
MTMSAMIEVDGSHGEGSGQILRMTVALSALTGRPVHISNIRAGRSNPGLRPQHVAAIEAVRRLCSGTVDGLHEHAMEISFHPGTLAGGSHSVDIGTAGSITLAMQACLPPMLYASKPSIVRLRGGTDVRWSPPWDYFTRVFLPVLRRVNIDASATLERRGYYPRGGGEAMLRVQPCSDVRHLSFDHDGDWEIHGRVNIAGLPGHIARRIRQAARKTLIERGLDADVSIEECTAASPGVGIVLWTTMPRRLGADVLGEKGTPAEEVGRKAAEMLLRDIDAGADLDVHAVDHLIPYMALADGATRFRCRELTGHAETELWLLQQFMDISWKKEPRNGCTEVTVSPEETG